MQESTLQFRFMESTGAGLDISRKERQAVRCCPILPCSVLTPMYSPLPRHMASCTHATLTTCISLRAAATLLVDAQRTLCARSIRQWEKLAFHQTSPKLDLHPRARGKLYLALWS